MSLTTLSGREAPSAKRIDVEANLLEQWLEERSRARRMIQMRLVGIGVILVATVGVATVLGRSRSAVSKKQSAVAQRLKAVRREYAEIVPATGDADPQATVDAILTGAKRNADAFMAQVVDLMNSASPAIAFSTLKADVLGGEVKLTGQADADTYYAANEFILRNNDATKGMNATQISTQRSDLLANDGVLFQFVKRVKVSP